MKYESVKSISEGKQPQKFNKMDNSINISEKQQKLIKNYLEEGFEEDQKNIKF